LFFRQVSLPLPALAFQLVILLPLPPKKLGLQVWAALLSSLFSKADDHIIDKSLSLPS
jgi:hypothetical protein